MLRAVPYLSDKNWRKLSAPYGSNRSMSFAFVTTKRAKSLMSFADYRSYLEVPYGFSHWNILRFARIDFWMSSRIIKHWHGLSGLPEFSNVTTSDIQREESSFDEPSIHPRSFLLSRITDIRIDAMENGLSLTRFEEINLALLSIIIQSNKLLLSVDDGSELIKLAKYETRQVFPYVRAGCPVGSIARAIEANIDPELLMSLEQ